MLTPSGYTAGGGGEDHVLEVHGVKRRESGTATVHHGRRQKGMTDVVDEASRNLVWPKA